MSFYKNIFSQLGVENVSFGVVVFLSILAQGSRNMPSIARKTAAKMNAIATQLNMKTCDHDASLRDIKNLRRRLLLRLHSDKIGGTTNPLFHTLQDAWQEMEETRRIVTATRRTKFKVISTARI
jgi:preprotein translocase subunit Sec63